MHNLHLFGEVTGPVVGRARTLRYLPHREDAADAPNGPVNRQLYDTIDAGDVLVLDCMGLTAYAALGDMMYSRLISRGVRAIVVDGAVRDIAVAIQKTFPVFARGQSPQPYFGEMRPWEADGDIQCCGVLVRAGDWIVGDTDGVVVVPERLVFDVVELAESKRLHDQFSQALLAAGFGLDDAYPLAPHMNPFLLRYMEDQILPMQEEVDAARMAASRMPHL
ncbi:RraA family protein [Caballeronia sordidicola]|uniref:RraA family protein n=1 Tax=Caballeronia sordidicola TaxID=196367 RepID=UPI003AF31A52